MRVDHLGAYHPFDSAVSTPGKQSRRTNELTLANSRRNSSLGILEQKPLRRPRRGHS